jgi:hypothetical protein
MGKKKGGNSSGAISKGERASVDPSVTKAVRNGRSAVEKMLNKQKAWKAGRKVNLLVPNLGADAKKRPFIKVSANEVWGDPKRNRFSLSGGSGDKSDDRTVL